MHHYELVLLQITNFYGASNDEYSQPRHCWDPSGNYIYAVSDHLLSKCVNSCLVCQVINLLQLQTSQDKSICVWEIRTNDIVCRLQGHTGTVVSSCLLLLTRLFQLVCSVVQYCCSILRLVLASDRWVIDTRSDSAGLSCRMPLIFVGMRMRLVKWRTRQF